MWDRRCSRRCDELAVPRRSAGALRVLACTSTVAIPGARCARCYALSPMTSPQASTGSSSLFSRRPRIAGRRAPCPRKLRSRVDLVRFESAEELGPVYQGAHWSPSFPSSAVSGCAAPSPRPRSAAARSSVPTCRRCATTSSLAARCAGRLRPSGRSLLAQRFRLARHRDRGGAQTPRAASDYRGAARARRRRRPSAATRRVLDHRRRGAVRDVSTGIRSRPPPGTGWQGGLWPPCIRFRSAA